MTLFISLLASAVLSTALAPVRLSPYVRAETRVPVPKGHEALLYDFTRPRHGFRQPKRRPKRKNR